jgi:uncharacterized alkaline shock family protein YloU
MTSPDINASLDQLSQPQFIYLAGGVLLLAFVLFLLLRRQPKSIVAYGTENGEVLVSRHAIVELVQTSCEQLKDVSKPRVKIRVKGKTVHFEVRIKLQSGGRLRDIEQTLQNHLRRALSENLGIEALGRINIIATGFKSGQVNAGKQGKEPHAPTVDGNGSYEDQDKA